MKRTIAQEISDIKAKLELIEGHMIWLITADRRFRVGQRVEFSRRARDRGFPKRKKSSKGFIKSVNRFTVLVKLDGYKHPITFHHAFFNPVTGAKLF